MGGFARHCGLRRETNCRVDASRDLWYSPRRLSQKNSIFKLAGVTVMRTTSLGFITPVFFLALTCRLPAQTNAANQVTSPRANKVAENDIVVRLAKARSIGDVDRVLTKLTAGKPKSDNFEWL